MRRSLFARKRIGLDLGGSALKAVLVRTGLFGATLGRKHVVPVPESRDKAPSGHGPGELLAGLPKLFRRFGGPGLGLDGGRAFYRWLDLPKMSGLSRAKRRAAAAFALEQDLPVGLEDLAVDVARWQKTSGRGARALAFGTDRDRLTGLLGELSKKGINPRLVSLDTLGLLTAAEVAGVDSGVILDLGHAKTTILCLDKGRLVGLGFSEIAGAGLERHLQESHGLVPDQAARRKLEMGSAQETESFFGPLMEALAKEAGRTIRAAWPDLEKPPGSLHLSGGTSRLPGLGGLLGDHLGLEAKPLKPLRRSVDPELIPALGLALADDGFDLGREFKPRTSSRRPLVLAALALIAVLALGGANLYQHLEKKRTVLRALVREETALVKASIPGLTRVVSPLRQMKSELTKVREEMSSLQGGETRPVIQALKDLETQAAKLGIKINEVVIDGSRVTLSGLTGSFDNLTRFQKALSDKGGFSGVTRQSGRMEGGSAGVRFSLRMKR